MMNKIAELNHKPLFQVFLDLTKAFDSVSRSRLLTIAKHYGMGPNLRALIKHYWDVKPFD